MTDRSWMEYACDAAKEAYEALLDEVVERHVLNDRENAVLPEETMRKLEKGQMAHPNVVRLLTISGKGGYSADVEKSDGYENYFNITLLDHLLSTARGALVFAAFEWLSQNAEMDLALLRRRLRVLAALALLHDLDKDLGLPRNTPLTDEMVNAVVGRYGLDSFLERVEVRLDGEQLRYLIEKVEATQAHRHPPGNLPPRDFESLPLFVRLADQLDGLWCLDDPEQGGLEGVLKRIRSDESVLHSGFLKSWKSLRLFDPHHPFLLDELQRWLTVASFRTSGVPPLIETHRDGELFMLLPGEHAEPIIKRAVTQLCSNLPFELRLDVSNRGTPSLYDASPSHEALVEFMLRGQGHKLIPDLFKIKRTLIEDVTKQNVTKQLDELLRPINLQPCPSDSGSLVSLYATMEGMEESSKAVLSETAHLVLLLNLKTDGKAKGKVPDAAVRAKALVAAVGAPVPFWIEGVSGSDTDASKRTLTALWVTALAQQNRELWEAVWGRDGMLKRWLEGDEEKPGLRVGFTDRGSQVARGLERRLVQLLGGKRVAPEGESERGRCLFTDEPARFDDPINQALGLHGVKVAAFSGRDGRPELVASERAHTVVSDSSVAEHRLRAKVHESLGGPNDGVPALISSPTTSGLFAGLVLTDDRSMPAMSVYDLNRLDVKKGRIVRETDIHRQRFRMARLERMPEKLTDQVEKIKMLLRGCRRIGRPIHIFRGLPMTQRAFFHYDAMPRPLVDLLGSNSLRLEQIPGALKHLERARVILNGKGLGYEVFRLYTNPGTRFRAICMAWCELRNGDKLPKEVLPDLQTEYQKLKEGKGMSERDGALVRFGQAAATIQKRPQSGASANEELMILKIAMDTVSAARRMGQVDDASLICAMAGELETNLSRRDKTWLTQPDALRKRCLDVAEFFVREVWHGVLQGKLPSQNDRRVLSSIYRMAFVMAHRKPQ